MGFNCSIIGLPNVGKSTLFNALTKASAAAENYPFCTIDPNIGIVPVPDARLNSLSDIVHPKEINPALMEFVDVAGLVKGAAKGEGLGNKFLGNIRETDAIAHVVRCFENPNIIHVSDKIDPLNDIAVINTELVLADLETIEKSINRISKYAKSGNKPAIFEKETLMKISAHLNTGQLARSLSLDEKEKAILNDLHLLTAKPVLYVANVAEDGFQNNPLLDQVTKFVQNERSELIVISARIESDLVSLDDDEKIEFLKELNLEEPGLNRLIRAGYALLGLHTFFTAGPKEVRAWTIKKGAFAPQAAGRIHSDFEKGFIRAEIIAYDDFIHYNGEIGAKAAGKWRLEGKDYIVQDGDVVHFRFNV